MLHLDVECLFVVDFFLSWSKLWNNYVLFTNKLVFHRIVVQMKKHVDLYHNFSIYDYFPLHILTSKYLVN